MANDCEFLSPLYRRSSRAASDMNAKTIGSDRHLLRLAQEEWELLDAVPRIRMEREQKVGCAG